MFVLQTSPNFLSIGIIIRQPPSLPLPKIIKNWQTKILQKKGGVNFSLSPYIVGGGRGGGLHAMPISLHS